MKVEKGSRGKEIVRFRDSNHLPCKVDISPKGNVRISRTELSKEELKEFLNHLIAFYNTGSFRIAEPTPEKVLPAKKPGRTPKGSNQA